MAKSLKADENEPSTTHNCESSRAPKKSSRLLKQQLTSERRTVKKQRARRNTVQIPSETTARKATENSTVHTSPFSVARRPDQESTTETTSGSEYPSRRKKSNTTNAPRAVAEHVFAVEPGIAQKSTMQRTCHRITQVHRHFVNVLHPTSNGAVVAQQRTHKELVQGLELLQHHGVDELNLEHLHSYPRECCVSRFFQYEPCTVSSRTQAWS